MINTVDAWFWLITVISFGFGSYYLNVNEVSCFFQKDWLNDCTQIIVAWLIDTSVFETGIYIWFSINLQKDIYVLFACYLIAGGKQQPHS